MFKKAVCNVTKRYVMKERKRHVPVYQLASEYKNNNTYRIPVFLWMK